MTTLDDTETIATDRDRPFQPAPEHPNEAQLQGLGDLSFLALREKRYANLSVKGLRMTLQPPVDLMQFHVFRFEGVPRAAMTWAFLSPEAEARIARGEPLAPRDWRSGPQMWVVDIFAPYGQGTAANVVRWLKQNLREPIRSVRYLRTSSEDGAPLRFIEVRRIEGIRWGTRLISKDTLEKGN